MGFYDDAERKNGFETAPISSLRVWESEGRGLQGLEISGAIIYILLEVMVQGLESGGTGLTLQAKLQATLGSSGELWFFIM